MDGRWGGRHSETRPGSDLRHSSPPLSPMMSLAPRWHRRVETAQLCSQDRNSEKPEDLPPRPPQAPLPRVRSGAPSPAALALYQVGTQERISRKSHRCLSAKWGHVGLCSPDVRLGAYAQAHSERWPPGWTFQAALISTKCLSHRTQLRVSAMLDKLGSPGPSEVCFFTVAPGATQPSALTVLYVQRTPAALGHRSTWEAGCRSKRETRPCLTKSFWKEMWNPDGATLPTKCVCSNKASLRGQRYLCHEVVGSLSRFSNEQLIILQCLSFYKNTAGLAYTLT